MYYKFYSDGCATKDGNKKEQVFPMLMRNNCPVFQFKDCCFEVQKDREGAARVSLFLCRLRFGKNLISLIVSLFRFLFVVLITASTSFITSMSTSTKKSGMHSASLWKTIMNPLRLKLRKHWKSYKALQETQSSMILVKIQKTLITLEIKMKSLLQNRKMPATPKTTKEV